MGLRQSLFRSTEPHRGDEYYVLGGNHLGASVARRLEAEGHTVRLIDDGHEPDDVSTVNADPTDLAALESAGMADAATVVVATPKDSQNFLLAQKLNARFDIPRIYVLVHTPDRRDLFEDAGHQTVCTTSLLTDGVVDRVSAPRPEVSE